MGKSAIGIFSHYTATAFVQKMVPHDDVHGRIVAPFGLDTATELEEIRCGKSPTMRDQAIRA